MSAPAAASNNPRFELTFAPTVILVSVVRNFIHDFYQRVIGKEATERIAMATHELLENALRYSAEDGATLKVEVEQHPNVDHVTIRIRNRPSEAHVGPLKEALAKMNEIPDPDLHYLMVMRESWRRKDTSGLGLARLRAEGGMRLSLELEGEYVCIVAQCDLEKQGVS